MDWVALANLLEQGLVRVTVALLLIWTFVYVNIRGATFYGRPLIPRMFLMFALGAIVIVAGFSYDHADFARALMETARAYASSQGASRLDLETAIDNHQAQALYEGLGYEREQHFYKYSLDLNT